MSAKHFYPNQYEFLGRRIFVAQNHPEASDDNPGTPEKPFKTISAATAGLKMGDHVYIDSGVYREEIPLPVGGHPYVPNSQIHFHAVLDAEVYIKGSDVFTGRWEPLEHGVWQADLPSQLFASGAYNPCRLALAKDVENVVRPCDDGEWPRTTGQMYVDGNAYRQMRNPDEVKNIKDTYIISADGKSILANFGSSDPSQSYIELVVRRRCIAPQFKGPVFMQTHGICIEHAAEPGPFCKDSPESLRENRQTSGIRVEKMYCQPGVAGAGCTLMPSQVCYLSTENNTIIASILDDTQRVLMFDQESIDAVSDDAGRTWIFDEQTRILSSRRGEYNYFLDESRNVLIRHWVDHINEKDPDGAFGVVRHNVMIQFSRDGGKTWSRQKRIDDIKIYCLSIVLLNDGSYILPYYSRDEAYPECPGESHKKIGMLLGRWNDDESGILWEQGGFISVSPRESNCGLAEPCLVQSRDGKLILFLRAGAVIPSQDDPGKPSVKLVSTSDDGGRKWTHPVPLCYEDGKFVYSPRSYQMAFTSIKNGRIYLLLNIAEGPTIGCDPRTHLYMVEVDPQILRVPRNSLTLIEANHPEHHPLTRWSNFQLIQDRVSRNPIIFMKLDMSEFCPIWQGYDRNMYRYEVFLPE